MDLTTAALTAGATLRLTRLVVADDIGRWWLAEPAYRAALAYHAQHGTAPWWDRYRSGLDCPFCAGFWIALGATATGARWGHTRPWRLLAGALTLSYLAAHIGARLGDTVQEESPDALDD